MLLQIIDNNEVGREIERKRMRLEFFAAFCGALFYLFNLKSSAMFHSVCIACNIILEKRTETERRRNTTTKKKSHQQKNSCQLILFHFFFFLCFNCSRCSNGSRFFVFLLLKRKRKEKNFCWC